MANPSRYRVVDFLGGRILESREMMTLQSMTHGVDPSGNTVTLDLDQLYRPGATQNITVTTSGLTASFSPTQGTLPMTAFIRGRWEVLQSGDLPPVTLSSGQTHIYLNYQIRIVTSTEDASLVDATTGAATANMGELDLVIGATDTSAVALNGTTQLEKNTSPIVMWQFTNNGSALTQVTLDDVNPPALASVGMSGLVSTTTANPVVVSTDDPRMTNGRAPLAGSVVDASVRVPESVNAVDGYGPPDGPSFAGNADGSLQYDLTKDAGGISADKIIWQEATERVSDFLAWIKAQVVSVTSTLASHIGQALGSVTTHPMPTASQVGAAPLSHVGMQLGLPGSHPPTVTQDSGGFSVYQDTTPGLLEETGARSTDAAYGVYTGAALVAGLLHTGDVYSTPLNALVTVPGGTPINFRGSLTTLLDVGTVLTDHVNQNSHGNPHGLALSDLGGISASAFTSGSNSDGYWTKDPTGKIDQWGVLYDAADGTTVSFPTGFTNLGSISISTQIAFDPGGGNYAGTSGPYQNTVTLNGFGLANKNMDSGSGPTNITIYWRAVGH